MTFEKKKTLLSVTEYGGTNLGRLGMSIDTENSITVHFSLLSLRLVRCFYFLF